MASRQAFAQRTAGVYYGWWIVAACVGLQMLMGALVMNAFGAYASVLRDEFGWSKTLFSMAFAMAQIENGLLGPVQGWLSDRFGPRVVSRIGVTVLGVGFLWFSQLGSPLIFFASYALIAVGMSLGGMMTLAVAVINWFERRRSLAMGLMSTGFAMGGVLVSVVIFSIESIGWRSTAFISGLLILLAGHGLASVLRHRPEDYGLHVDGDRPAEREPVERPGRGGPVERTRDFTAREALRTRAFWMLSLGHGSALLIVSAVMVHLVLHLNEGLGYSLGVAGLIISLMTVCQVLGMLIGGYLGDIFNKRLIAVICMAGHVVALLLLAYASALWMVLLFAILHGLAWGARGPQMQSLRADYFGRSSFGLINGLATLFVMIGMTLGPLVAGILADQTGSYELGFTILAGMAALGSISFVLASPPSPPGSERSTADHDPEPSDFAVAMSRG